MRVVGAVHNCRNRLPLASEEVADRVFECDCGRLWACEAGRTALSYPLDPPAKRTRWNRKEWAEYEASKAKWERVPPYYLWHPYEGPVDPA